MDIRRTFTERFAETCAIAGVAIGIWILGFEAGKMTVPSPPEPPPPAKSAEEVRADLINACFRQTTNSLRMPSPEQVMRVREQCASLIGGVPRPRENG